MNRKTGINPIPVFSVSSGFIFFFVLPIYADGPIVMDFVKFSGSAFCLCPPLVHMVKRSTDYLHSRWMLRAAAAAAAAIVTDQKPDFVYGAVLRNLFACWVWLFFYYTLLQTNLYIQPNKPLPLWQVYWSFFLWKAKFSRCLIWLTVCNNAQFLSNYFNIVIDIQLPASSMWIIILH